MGDTEELRGEDPAVEHGNAKTVEAEPEVHEEPVVYYGTASPVEPETVEEPDDFGTEAEDVVEEIDDDAADMTEAEEMRSLILRTFQMKLMMTKRNQWMLHMR